MERQNEIDETKAKYRKQCRNGFIAGCGFIVAAIVFTILGVILQKPSVLCGVVLQIIAGITLIITNRKGMQS